MKSIIWDPNLKRSPKNVPSKLKPKPNKFIKRIRLRIEKKKPNKDTLAGQSCYEDENEDEDENEENVNAVHTINFI